MWHTSKKTPEFTIADCIPVADTIVSEIISPLHFSHWISFVI